MNKKLLTSIFSLIVIPSLIMLVPLKSFASDDDDYDNDDETEIAQKVETRQPNSDYSKEYLEKVEAAEQSGAPAVSADDDKGDKVNYHVRYSGTNKY